MERDIPGEDHGFSLMEVVVAMLCFAIVVVAVASLLVSSVNGSRSNTQRVAAANIARQQIEAVRAQRALDIKNGVTDPLNGGTITEDGTAYSVSQTANYTSLGSDASICDGTGTTLAYKRVTMSVTWPNMGSTKPVVADTVVSLGLNDDGLDTSTGSVAVLVQGADGKPEANVPVVVGSSAQTTGADGCVVFTGLAAGTYAASATKSGYVSTQGEPTASTTGIVVTGGSLTKRTLYYDQGGRVAVTASMPAGYTAPGSLAAPAVTLKSSIYASSTQLFRDCADALADSTHCVSGTPRTSSLLWPQTYSAWVGQCADSGPSNPPTFTVASGVTSTATDGYGAVDVSVKKTNVNGPALSKTITVTHGTDSTACQATIVVTVGTGSSFKVALPRGTWTFAATTNNVSASQATVTVDPAAAKTATVVASS